MCGKPNQDNWELTNRKIILSRQISVDSELPTKVMKGKSMVSSEINFMWGHLIVDDKAISRSALMHNATGVKVFKFL